MAANKNFDSILDDAIDKMRSAINVFVSDFNESLLNGALEDVTCSAKWNYISDNIPRLSFSFVADLQKGVHTRDCCGCSYHGCQMADAWSAFANKVADLFVDAYDLTDGIYFCNNADDIVSAVSDLACAITKYIHFDDGDIVPDDLYADLMGAFMSHQNSTYSDDFYDALKKVVSV